MTWIVFNAASCDVERLDFGVDKPEGVTSEFSSVITNWPAPPSVSSVLRWKNSAFVWEDDRTFLQKKASKRSAIKNARESKEFGPFTWSGSIFDGDEKSQARIMVAAFRASRATILAPFSEPWTLADNSTRTLSGADMVAVCDAMTDNIMTVHATWRTLRAQIEAATDSSQIDATSWPT
jgi:Domain of unknown function (DUF4376)